MGDIDHVYVRDSMLDARPAPMHRAGVLEWTRRSFFGSTKDTILTILAVTVLIWLLPPALNWLFFNAAWTGSGREACATVAQGGNQPDGWSGACWAFVNAKFDQFIFGRYPLGERWRPVVVFTLFVLLLIPLLIPRVPHKALNAISMFIVLPVASIVLLVGGVFGLRYVETSEWGGLLVTLTLSFVGISVSLPLGVLLALGRRSILPVVRALSTVFIEFVRGVPLILVLFISSLVLPLFLPDGVTIDKFVRALVGVSLFASAYMAEVVRGGLQAVAKGQYEGADALGLNYPQKMVLVILPQALKLVIPGIVNTFIGLLKDTSLVTIIAMFDLLGIIRQSFSDPNWASSQTPATGLVFAGFVFWVLCFSMSRYSIFTERRLVTAHKK